MKLIAHRGNVSGPKPSQENNPEYIDEALFAEISVDKDGLKRRRHSAALGRVAGAPEALAR